MFMFTKTILILVMFVRNKICVVLISLMKSESEKCVDVCLNNVNTFCEKV